MMAHIHVDMCAHTRQAAEQTFRSSGPIRALHLELGGNCGQSRNARNFWELQDDDEDGTKAKMETTRTEGPDG